jgi:hypothetical protein
MPTEQLLLRLPADLIRKFRRNVPDRQRSAFVRALLEQALDVYSDAPHQKPLAVGADGHLPAEMAWEEATVADGAKGGPARE